MNIFSAVAVAVIAGLIVSRMSASGTSLSSALGLSPAGGNTLNAAQQAQLSALAKSVQAGQTATSQQVAAMNQALQQLSKNQQSGSGKGGSGAPSGGSGAPLGSQKGSQTYDPIAQAFLSSDLNSQQATTAEQVLKSGGTIEDAATAAGVSNQDIINAIAPQMEGIIAATAPVPSDVTSNLDTAQLTPIDPTPGDVGIGGGNNTDATFADAGSSAPQIPLEPLIPIDSSTLICNTLNASNQFTGQDPCTNPAFINDNSLVGTTVTPSCTDMSVGAQQPAPFNPCVDNIQQACFGGGGSAVTCFQEEFAVACSC